MQITDYALVESVKSLFDGAPLVDGLSTGRLGLSSTDVLRMLKEHDVEFSVRARPAWRADGDRTKHARGFYEVRIYLWEQFGPLAGLDYRVRLTESGGARTVVNSSISLDVRRFCFRDGDRLIFMIANLPCVHRMVNGLAERAVLAAEWGLVNGIAAFDHARRAREREERRKQEGTPIELDD